MKKIRHTRTEVGLKPKWITYKFPLYLLMIFFWGCFLCTLVCADSSTPGIQNNFDTTEALIDLLKEKGIINNKEAQSFLKRHQEQAKSTRQVITIQPPENQEDQEAYIRNVNKGVTEKLTKDLNDLKENYEYRSEDLVKRSILLEREVERLEEMLTEEHKPQLQKSSWAQRIRFGGDIRLRHESILYDKGNATNVYKVTSDSTSTELMNTTRDEHRQRARIRVSAKAKLMDPSDVNVGKVTAGFRLATGSITNPVSTNYTLGDDSDDRANLVLDRAYVKWTFRPEEEILGNMIPEVSLTGGVMENPFFSSSLVFDSDLAFEGVALGLKTDTNEMNKWSSFLTLGYFPLEESEWTQRDKYMLGGQIGFKHRPAYGWEYKLGVSYFQYENVEGFPITSTTRTTADDRELERMAPKYLQKGNSLFDMDQTGTNGTTYGLMSDFRLLNITGQIENSLFFPIRIRLYWDWVKNLGYDPDSMAAKISTTKKYIESVSGDIGYQIGLKVGDPKPRERWAWNVSVEYRYLESDAVLDAFADSDFHLGGTNSKGYILGAELGLYENVWLSARWMSANEIDDMQRVDTQLDDLSVDILQLNVNAEFYKGCPMKEKTGKGKTGIIIIFVLMVAGLSGSGFLFYQKLQLNRQITGLEQDIEDLSRRERILQKKYIQEKAKMASCARAKMAETSKNAQLIKTVTALKAEKASFEAEKAAIEKTFQAKLDLSAKKIAALETYKEKMKQAREELIEKYKTLARTDREKAGQISDLKIKKQELSSNLKMTKGELKRSLKHNARLCEIAEELTEKYREKNGISADPFTKIGMVELEHMLQQYLKNIDKEKIITQ